MKSVYCPSCGTQFQRYRLTHQYCSTACKDRHRYTIGKRTTEKTYEKINGNWSRYLSRLLTYHGRRKTLTAEFLVSVLEKQDYKCALSGVKLTCALVKGKKHWTNASIDRIRPGKPYSRSNIQLVCLAINQWRGTHSVDEFIRWCNLVAKHNRGKTAPFRARPKKIARK